MRARTSLVAAFSASAAVLSACDDSVGPHGPAPRAPARPVFDHGASTFAMAFQSCDGDYSDGRYGCGISARLGDGTTRHYRLEVPEDWDEDGVPEVYSSHLARPTWSPDATRVAADDEYDIFLITLSDGGIVNLTNNPATDHSPAWSPDGGRIAFVSDRDGLQSLYLMRAADGGGVTRVTSGVEVLGSPTWSPDATRIAFTCRPSAYEPYEVCAVNADGSGFARLTSNVYWDSDPDWSPDGTRIAFVTARYNISGLADIATMAPDGSNVTRLTRSIWKRIAHLDWSPGGTRIAFESDPCLRTNYNTCVPAPFVMNADGSAPGIIGAGGQPEWRPGAADPPPTTDLPPVARFTHSCTNLTCQYDASSSTDDHGIATYSWTFGDGYSSGPMPFPTGGKGYFAPGTYTVTLTVTDYDGHSASVSQDVTTGPAPPDEPPAARFLRSCKGRVCYFQSYSIDDRGIVSYLWTFGDGSSVSNVTETSHTYAADGTYSVTLTVGDAAGQTSSLTQSVTVVDGPPTASFSWSCGVGRACNFNSSASSDDGGIVSRTWTFGDGSSASDATAPTHTFAANGTYAVTLTVRDAVGQTNSVTQSVTTADDAPVARFTYSCASGACTFDGTASTDDRAIASYRWDLGRYGTASGPSVTIQPKGRTPFSVTLTVADQAGQTNSTTQTVTFK